MEDKVLKIKEYISQNPSATREDICKNCSVNSTLLKNLKDRGIISYIRKKNTPDTKLSKDSEKIVQIRKFISENNPSVNQICEEFGFSRQTLYTYINNGFIDRKTIVGSKERGETIKNIENINAFIKETNATIEDVARKFNISKFLVSSYKKKNLITEHLRRKPNNVIDREKINLINNFIDDFIQKTGNKPYLSEVLKNTNNTPAPTYYRYAKAGLVDSTKVRKHH